MAAPVPVAVEASRAGTPSTLPLPAANSAVRLLRPAAYGAAAAAELPLDDAKGELPVVLLPLPPLPCVLLGGAALLAVLWAVTACCAVASGGSWASAQSAGICSRGGGVSALHRHSM